MGRAGTTVDLKNLVVWHGLDQPSSFRDVVSALDICSAEEHMMHALFAA